jgi:hypothetical protein
VQCKDNSRNEISSALQNVIQQGAKSARDVSSSWSSASNSEMKASLGSFRSHGNSRSSRATRIERSPRASIARRNDVSSR